MTTKTLENSFAESEKHDHNCDTPEFFTKRDNTQDTNTIYNPRKNINKFQCDGSSLGFNRVGAESRTC